MVWRRLAAGDGDGFAGLGLGAGALVGVLDTIAQCTERSEEEVLPLACAGFGIREVGGGA
jgi:hypothetical protein